MEVETKEIRFSVSGKFITNLAREWFYLESRPLEKVMDLLLSCMCGTDMSEKELRRNAEDVLLGRAEFEGNTRDNSFRLVKYSPDEQPDIASQFDIFERYSKESQLRKDAEKKRDKYLNWYEIAMEYVPNYSRNEVLNETGQPIESDPKDGWLSSFMERMLDEEEHSTEDYGWLAPDGTFHEVEWGNHQEWAQNYIEEHFPEVADDSDVDLQQNCNVGLIGAGDWLVERGWILLHSPSQGIAFPTRNPLKRYTKAQQEFLYDYYMERGKEKEANSVYSEE